MAFMDKLKFWKKSDASLGLDSTKGIGLDNSLSKTYDPALGNIGADMGTTYLGSGFNNQNPTPQHDDFEHDGSFSPTSFQQAQAFQQQRVQPMQQSLSKEYSYGVDKDLEVISAKLDSIRAMLESLNQRVANIERIANASQQTIPNKNQYGRW